MFKPLALIAVTFLAIIAWGLAEGARAQEAAPKPTTEQILTFDSDITVVPDGTLQVRETLRVSVTGASIKHGIYRDFPTRYRDRFGNPYTIHLDVASVERDGQPEPFHLDKLSNGLRIYMGKRSQTVPPGEHTYALGYNVEREIGFFPDHDELYWNVTGNGWIFPIQEITATVHLPGGIAREAILLDGYTGQRGSVQTDYTAAADSESNATFRTTRPLTANEGLTIVVRWPKGFVHPPTSDQEYRFFLEDNQTTLIGILGLLVTLGYYVAAWFFVGRRPEHGEIVPRSEPPAGFSPAAIRFLRRMAFDQKALVANLVDLAVKKKLAILEDGNGGYILGRFNPKAPPPGPRIVSNDWTAPEVTADEQVVLDRLFAGGDTVRLEPASHALVGGAAEALHYHLRTNLEKSYFLTNSRYLIPGLLISLATVVRCGLTIQGGQRFMVFFLTFWLLVWSVCCLALVAQVLSAWRNALSDPHHSPTARKQAIFLSVICLPFLLGEAVGLGALVWAASAGVVGTLILLVAINYAFHYLLKSPTRLGRALMDQIEGFRLFLAATEKDRATAGAVPKTTPPVFEKFLPYAMALNVEKIWGEKFAFALAHAAKGASAAYSPSWYSGAGWDPVTAATFATSLGNSFSSAISASTSAPGESSGSSGSSGGGGGGGGGGGW